MKETFEINLARDVVIWVIQQQITVGEECKKREKDLRGGGDVDT